MISSGVEIDELCISDFDSAAALLKRSFGSWIIDVSHLGDSTVNDVSRLHPLK